MAINFDDYVGVFKEIWLEQLEEDLNTTNVLFDYLYQPPIDPDLVLPEGL